MTDIWIIRTQWRRRYREAEKAVLTEVDRGGCTVAEVARRHGMAESLLYDWRSHRRARASVASEPLRFIFYGEVTDAVVDLPATITPPAISAPAPPASGIPPSGAVDIDFGSGVRMSVDSHVNEKALARVLRALQDVRCSR